jgi:hypothetical protein
MSKMNAWLGVFVSFLMINGCFGTLAVIFCWGEILERCCTAYVQLESEEDEVAEETEDPETVQDNHVELRVISSENEVQATVGRLQENVVSKQEIV